jgi:hypothetical protein
VPGELAAVQVEVDPAREGSRAVMTLPLRIGVRDDQAQLPVEGDSASMSVTTRLN